MMTSKKRTGNDPGVNQGSPNTPEAPERDARKGVSAEYIAGYRQHAYEMRDKGLLPSQRLAMEILYLLPDDFMNFYSALFHQALVIGDSSVMAGRSGGLGKSPGAQGMVTGSETKRQAMGSGKRWKNPAYTIGSETAFEVKRELDKRLGLLVTEMRGILIQVRNAESGTPGVRDNGAIEGQTSLGSIRCQGLRREWVDRGDGVRPKCGTFLKAEWTFCPKCGTRRK